MAPAERAAETVDGLLASARDQLDRLSPESALREAQGGAVLVDIRSEAQLHRGGLILGATVIPRNVLEWRLDPACADRDPKLAQRGRRVILICDEGYQSSLAAATLKRFGLDATDVIGRTPRGWRAAGLPLEPA